jgi:dTDP-4-dehydrorhamnose 3,5-epimerase
MNFIPTKHPEIFQIEPDVFFDERGFFFEAYQKNRFSKAGITYQFVQDNHSSSIQNTLRGLHYQITHPQGKLVRVIIGEIFDVAVDLRKSSKHFGSWVGVVLSALNKKSLWIPPGFAHGFITLSDRADVLYKATDYYDPPGERYLRWDDPDIAIKWPIPPDHQPLLSSKDANGAFLANAEVYP